MLPPALPMLHLMKVVHLVQLKILTWQNEEIASDALSIHGYEHYEATDYALAAWYPRQPKALGASGTPAKAATPSERDSDFTKWWADGDEPLYYIVSSKVTRSPCPMLLSQSTPPACLGVSRRRWRASGQEVWALTPVATAWRVAGCGAGCGGGEAEGWGRQGGMAAGPPAL